MTQMNTQTQTQIDRIRAREAAKARERIAAQGIKMSSPEATEMMQSALDRAEDGAWNAAYNKAMQNLSEMGVSGISVLDNEEDIKALGSRYMTADEDIETYARLAADQFTKGMTPTTWGDYKKNKRGVVPASFQEMLGNALVSFEGSVGMATAGAWSAWDMYGYGGKMWQEGPITTEQQMQHFAGMMEAQQTGSEFARFYATPVGLENAAEELAGPPGEPVLPSERFGTPGGAVGEFVVSEAGNIGSALGSMPMSGPSMLAPNLSLRAVAMAPFAFSGYGDAKMARYDIWREQTQMAEYLGIAPPPMPSTGEFETWGGLGAAFEVGSEFIGDSAQVTAIKIAGGGKLGRWGGKRFVEFVNTLQDSFARTRGPLGTAKRVGLAVGGSGLTEGAEEFVPHIGEQAQDVASELFTPDDSYWEGSIDRALFSEDSLHSAKVGAYSGMIMGGGAYVASPTAFKRRREAREVAAEARKGTSFVTESIIEGQKTDAAEQVAPSPKDKATQKQRALENFRRSVVPTRSSAMAMHHVEQLSAGNRGVMVIDPADIDTTLTPEVRKRMRALGISEKPIGTIDGKKVFAANGDIAQVMDMIKAGDFESLGGNPLRNDGQVMMGAVVLKDAGGRVVEIMPYSDPTQMHAAAPAIAAYAAQNGLTVSAVNHETSETYSDINDSVRRVQDADAVQLGLPQRERQAPSNRDTTRGVRALRMDIERDAKGSKSKRRAKATDAFVSPYLTAEEIGDATNGDVTVTVTMSRVADQDLSDGERNLSRITDSNATVLDGKIVFSIKQKDGSVKTVEKPVRMDGVYLPQVSPDGIFLMRENGTAMTSRSAFAIALHEMRHRTLSRSKNGALYFAKLLQLDPAYAMRGGAQYMRRMFENKFAGQSDAKIIAYYRGLFEAAQAVRQGVATPEQQKTVAESRLDAKGQPIGTVGSALSEVRTFSEESVTTTANRAFGQTMTKAAEWEGIYRDAQEKSFRRFSAWMANALVKNGFVGPEAQQALYELRQRLDNVREEETKIHRKFSDTVSEAMRRDLETAKRRDEARQALRGGQPAGAAPASTPSAAPSAAVSPSLREPKSPMGINTIGGDDDKRQQIEQAISAVQEAQNAPPEQRDSMLANAIGLLTQIAPLLSQTSAQLAPSSGATRPQMQSPTTRRIPESMRDAAPAPAAPEPQLAGGVERVAPDLEASARRQRNAQNAMAIMRGETPSEPVDLGTVSRIERARTFMQDPEEEIRMSVRERPGRREANDDVRSIRNAFMEDRGIEPEQRIEDTYAEVDPDFAKRLADWYQSTEVDYNDPKMLAAYRQFGRETLDQYNYLREKGYEMIPWAGEGQPYADSADMIEDLRTNKRLFYYKTINPQEQNSFGSNPQAFQEALRKNPLLEDAGVEVLDSEGNPYRQTYNDLFRGVHDILGHGAEGFQFGPRGEENAYRSHAVMFSPLARQAMATETRSQNSWVNYGPNRRNPDGSVWGQEDPRYGPWLDRLKNGEGYADQKPMLTPPEFLGLYSQREQPQVDAISSIDLDAYSESLKSIPRGILKRHMDSVRKNIDELKSDEYPVGAFVVAAKPVQTNLDTTETLGYRPYMTGAAIETMDTYGPEYRIENPKVGDIIGGEYQILAIKNESPARYSRREEKPDAKKAIRGAAARQRRKESDIKRESVTRKKAKLDKPAISISAEVTAEPFINPNIIIPSAANDPQFSKAVAYARINDQVGELLKNATYRKTLNDLISVVTDGRVKSIGPARTILGSYGGRVEQSMRISIPGATHEDHVAISNLLGSLLMQEAAITIGEPDPSTPKAEQAMAFVMYASDDISDANLRTLLASADKQLVGASTTETGKGVWAVYTPYPGNPLTEEQFENNAIAFAKANNLTIEAAPVRSTYTLTGGSDVLGRKRKPTAVQGGRNRRNRELDPRWSAWVNAAAPIVEALRDEGFDINIPGWVGKIAGAEAKDVENALIDTLAERNAGGRHGLDWRFIRRAGVSGQGLTDGYAIPAKTTPSNAEASFAEVDALLERHPNALKSAADFERFMVDLFKSRDIPIIPADLLASVANDFERMRKEMNLRSNGGRLTDKMVDEAIHGLEMAQRFRALYAAGKVTPEHTVMLAMWGFLSRGVSPYIQESLFLDIVNYRSSDGKTLKHFVDIAIAGAWTKPKKDKEGKIILPDNSTDTEWRAWVQEMFADAKYELMEDPELGVEGTLETKNASVGSGASHNANAFGVSFLGNIGKPVNIRGKTQSGLLHFHEALANPNATGKDVRRVFASLGGSLGIDNKVVGFSSLVAGKTDISVYDRVRVRDHFDRDGNFPNIYDGYTVGYAVYDHGEKVAEYRTTSDLRNMTEEQRREMLAPSLESAKKDAEEWTKRGPRMVKKGKMTKASVVPVKIAGLANLFNGARGIAIYEVVERGIDPNAVFSAILKARPDLIPYANHGAEHWLNWVGASAQEASHKTLDGLIAMISSGETQIVGVSAKEGRYDTFHYGGEYGYKDVGGKPTAMYRYEFNGQNWEFEPSQYHAFIKSLSSFDWAGLNYQPSKGTKKPKFLVSVDSSTGKERTTPWHADPMLGSKGSAKIIELANEFGSRMSLRDMPNEDALDAFATAFVDSLRKNPIPQVVSSVPENNDVMREFARQNIAAQTHEQAYELYKRMVEQKFPKPTIARYTMYFDRDNALNGIVPNDVWWHGGSRQWTTPNYNISPNQFGLHIGNFNQASHFFQRAIENAKWQSNPPVTPVMFPLYARAFKTIEIMDQGSWEPERILNGMRDVELITRDEQKQAVLDMYDAVGLPVPASDSEWTENIRWHKVLGGISILNLNIESDAAKMRDCNIWMREWLAERDIDAIRYQNYIEGKTRSDFMEEPSMYGINTEAKQQYRMEWERKGAEFSKWVKVAPMGPNGFLEQRRMMEKQKEIFGDLSSIIVWNTGQVKSASADDVGFRTSMSDIRASMRHQPPAVVNMYPEVFSSDEARYSQRNGLAGRSDAATVAFIDQYDPLRRYGEIAEQTLGSSLPDIANPYLGLRVLSGRLGSMQQQATRDYATILRDMHDHNIELNEMDEFLTAQHALNGGNAYIAAHNPRFPDGGTGMTNADAQAVIMRAQASGRYGDMNRIAEDWRQMLREGLRLRRDAGLITNETYNILTTRYTHYVPLRGAPARPFDENFEDFDSGEVFGRGMSTQGRGMPRRYGRESRAEGVTSQVGFLHEDTMRRVARNEIGQRFLRLVMLVNDPGMATVVTPNPTRMADVNGVFRPVYDANWMNNPRHFGVYVNQRTTINGVDFEPGDLVVIHINNAHLADAINTPNAQLSQFAQGLRHVNNTWRFVTTGMGNPTFAPVNMVRDVSAGSINNIAAHGLRDTAQMLRRYPRAFINVFRDAWRDPNRPTYRYRRFVEAGGDQLYWRPNDLETKNTDFDALAERVARRDPNDTSLARTLFGWYPAFFTAAETATRLAQFEQRLATGSSAEQAALAARDITVDFAKGGKRKAALNTYYMFLNASIQGSVNVARSVGRAAAIAPALVTFGAVSALIGRALGGEDEETEGDVWDNIPDYEKASNIILMDPFGSGKYIKIPLPYGFSTFYSAGVRMADAALGKSTAGDAVAGMIADSLNSFNPFGGSGIKQGLGSVVAAFIPTMARPAMELSLNQNWMGRPIFPKSFGKQEKADAYSYFTGTPEFYTEPARILNDATGGDMFESGMIDMSPNTMQYLVGYYLSGAGRTVDRLAKMAVSAEPTELSDIPMLRSFAGDARSDTRSLSERYNAIAARTMPDINRAEALTDPDVPLDVKQGIRERGIDRTNIAIGKVVTAADKKLREVNQRMKEATPEQRQRLREVRERAMKRVIRESNRLTPD